MLPLAAPFAWIALSVFTIPPSAVDAPAEYPPDPVLPKPAAVDATLDWAAAAFAGQQRAGKSLELELRRQEHGSLRFKRSTLDTPLKIGAKSYERGLGTHAYSESAVKLPPAARRFLAEVGIDNNHDTKGQHGSVVFIVECDGRELLRTPTLRGGAEPVAVDLELPKDARSLLLKVETTEDGPGHDQADWADARLLLEDKSAMWLDDAQPNPFLLADQPPFSFRYDGADAATLLRDWPRKVDTQDQPDRRIQRVTWTDPKTKLAITAVVTAFKTYGAVDWVLYFENQGPQDTPILEDIQALDAFVHSGPAEAPLVLHQVKGDTGVLDTFLLNDIELEAGKGVKAAAEGGRSSNTSFPFMNLQAGQRGFITAIGWTGQWAMSLNRDAGGAARLRAGMEKTHLRLHPGEKIRSPRIVVLPWEGDLQDSYNRFRRLMLFKYVPQADGRPIPAPVALQSFDRYARWLPEWGTEAGQIRSAEIAKQLGCDTLWLDAAWFPGNFPYGVGNWSCKPEQFPNGLKPVSDKCHELGLRFLLWFEPERVAPNTQIAREHPEFMLPGDDEWGGLFKLHDPAARRWLTDLLLQRFEEYGVDIFRNDFNMDPLKYWQRNDEPDRQGMTEIRYVEGLYEMWDELRARRPGLTIDNCASGGRRIDLEMCMRSWPLWRSDLGCTSVHPTDVNQVEIQGLSLYIPFHAVASWGHEAYEVRSVASSGIVCQWDYLGKDFPLEAARKSLDEARANQPFWLGDFYPQQPSTVAMDQWAAYQFHRPDLDAGIVLCFRRRESNYTGLSLNLRALAPERTYEVEFVDDAHQAAPKTMTGAELAKAEVQLPKKHSSMLIRYRPAGQAAR